jgi:hypothetical protein
MYPDVMAYHDDLGVACYSAGLLLFPQKKWSEVRAPLRRGLAAELRVLQLAPDHPRAMLYLRQFATGLSQADVQLGDHAEAARTMDELARHPKASAEDAYVAACGHGVCAGLAEKDERLAAERRKEAARAYADRGLALLREAVKRGFKDARRLKEDPDLAPLRPREEFKKLLAEVERPPDGK